MNITSPHIKRIKFGVSTILSLILFTYTYQFLYQIESENLKLDINVSIDLKTESDQDFQLYYSEIDRFSPEKFINKTIKGSSRFQTITFNLPDLETIKILRLDFGTKPQTVEIMEIIFTQAGNTYKIDAKQIMSCIHSINEIKDVQLINNKLIFSPIGTADSFVIFGFNYSEILFNIKKSSYWIAPFFESFILSVLVFIGLLKLSISFKPIKYSTYLIKKYDSDLAFILFFLIIISSPILIMLTIPEAASENDEKRSKAQLQEYKIKDTYEYSAMFTAFFNDNFRLRKSYIKTNNLFKTKILNSSPIPNMVVLGKEDWLYYSYDCNPMFKHAGHFFTASELKYIKVKLEEYDKFLKNRGAKFYLFIPPTKNTIYPEYLPARFKRFESSKMSQLIEYLNENSEINVIDVRSELFKAKEYDQIYYSADTHWNMKGAFVGYQKLITTISKDFPSINPISNDNISFNHTVMNGGDLSVLMNLPSFWRRNIYTLINDIAPLSIEGRSDQYENIPFLLEKSIVREVQDTTKPRLIMYRDSYSGYLIPNLSEHFSKSIYLWTYRITPTVIEQEQPDIVVLEIIERFLEELLIQNPEGIKDN